MKNKLLTLILGVFALSMFVSCNDDSDPVSSNGSSGTDTLTGEEVYSGQWSGTIETTDYSGTWQFTVNFDSGRVTGNWFVFR